MKYCEKLNKPINYKEHILPILYKIFECMNLHSPEQHAVQQYIDILNEQYEMQGELKNLCLQISKSIGRESKYYNIVQKMLYKKAMVEE